MTRYVRGPLEQRVLGVFETHIAARPRRVHEVIGGDVQAISRVLNRLAARGEISKHAHTSRNVEYWMTWEQRAAAFRA